MAEQAIQNAHFEHYAAISGTNTGFGFSASVPDASDDVNAPRPRRRLKDTSTDNADGLNALIQKTKAVSVAYEEPSNLGTDEGVFYHLVFSANYEQQLEGTKYFRKYVCGEGSEQRAQNVIDWKILHAVAGFFRTGTPQPLLFESLWILTNIAAGPTSHTTAIVDLNFLPLLVGCLRHPCGAVRTQAAWAIGNIVGDREGYRDIVLNAGVLDPLLKIWELGNFTDVVAQKESFRIAMWVVDNMCRYKPDWHKVYLSDFRCLLYLVSCHLF